MDWQYYTGLGECRQWENTVSYGPMGYQVWLKPNYWEREERKVTGALLITKDENSVGTPPCLSGPEGGGHAPTYIPIVSGQELA